MQGLLVVVEGGVEVAGWVGCSGCTLLHSYRHRRVESARAGWAAVSVHYCTATDTGVWSAGQQREALGILTVEGKEAAVLGQDLLKVLLGHVRYLQQAVQVEAQYWQDPQTHVT